MLLSIDPGLNNCGIAVSEVGDNFKVVETVNIKNTRKFTPEEKTIEAFYNARVVKINAIEEVVRGLLDKYKTINEVAIEAPFYHASTPAAFSSLLEVISVIRHKIFVPLKIKIVMVEPMLVKKLFITTKLTKGMNGKEFMKEFLKKRIADGHISFSGNVDELTEHEIDAIGVGFTSKILEQENKE